MCSINGIYSINQQNFIEPRYLDIHKDIANKIKYRGPDASNSYTDNQFCLFTSELKITDISKSIQPFEYKNRYVIGFNGEIYNKNNLIKELEDLGVKFQDKIEVEIIAQLYEKFNKEFLKKINGIFSIVIYDKQNNDIILARDKFGEKPLFYCFEKNCLHFCSESNYLRNILSKSSLSEEGLIQYLTFGFAFNNLIKGVQRLNSGCALIISNGKQKIYKYWKPTFNTNYNISLNHAILTSLKLLNNNIEEMFPKEVKSGVYISGGIDSSVVAKILNNNFGDIDLFTSGLNLKSIKEENLPVDKDYYYVETKGNELNYTDELARFIKGTYHKNLFSVTDLVSSLEDMIKHLPGGPVMSTSFPLFYFTALKSKNFKVCFTGEGADELNGGYATSQPELYGNSISRSFISLSDYFSKEELFQFFGKKGIENINDICNTLDNEIENEFEYEGKKADELFNKIRFFHLNKIFGPHLLEKADGMTMGKAPTELRMPFLSGDYVQYILNLPQSILRFDGMRKFLVYQMAEYIHVPKEIIYRKQKQRTSLPYYQLFFLNKEFKKYVQTVLNKNSCLADILKIKEPGEYIYNLEGTMNAHKRAWIFLILEIWLKHFLK